MSLLEQHYAEIDHLVERAQAGDSEAIEDLMDFYRPLIRGALQRCMARDRRLIAYREDLEAEMFPLIHGLIRNYNRDLSYFSYYLSTRLEYAILTQSRRFLGETIAGQANDAPPAPAEEPEETDDPFGRLHNRLMLQSALERLPAPQREAVHLYYFQQQTQARAAQNLGITQSAFCKRLKAAIEGLRGILSES